MVHVHGPQQHSNGRADIWDPRDQVHLNIAQCLRLQDLQQPYQNAVGA